MIKPDHELATWMFAARLSLLEDGYDASVIMLKAGLNLDLLSSSTHQLPKSTVQKVWRTIEKETGDDVYCLRTLEHVSDPYLNALIASIQACGTVQNALQLLFKYSQVVHPGMNFGASIGERLELKMVPKNADVVTDSDLDVTFGLFSRICRKILTSELKPTQIRIARSEPRNLDAYLSYFDCPVEFGSESSSIEFPINVLSGTIPGEDPVLAKNLEMYLSEQVEKSSVQRLPVSIEDEIHTIVEPMLRLGTPKISAVADELGLSVRSLQRRLRSHDLSFSSLLTSARLKIAKDRLRNDSYESLETVATRTGFTETSNFVRFFKQHTGQTPGEFTKKKLQKSI